MRCISRRAVPIALTPASGQAGFCARIECDQMLTMSIAAGSSFFAVSSSASDTFIG